MKRPPARRPQARRPLARSPGRGIVGSMKRKKKPRKIEMRMKRKRSPDCLRRPLSQKRCRPLRLKINWDFLFSVAI